MEATKPCPYCSEAIQDAAVKCRHCCEWLDKPGGSPLHTLKEIRAFVLQYPRISLPILQAKFKLTSDQTRLVVERLEREGLLIPEGGDSRQVRVSAIGGSALSNSEVHSGKKRRTASPVYFAVAVALILIVGLGTAMQVAHNQEYYELENSEAPDATEPAPGDRSSEVEGTSAESATKASSDGRVRTGENPRQSEPAFVPKESSPNFEIVRHDNGPEWVVVQVRLIGNVELSQAEVWCRNLAANEYPDGRGVINLYSGPIDADHLIASFQGGVLYKAK